MDGVPAPDHDELRVDSNDGRYKSVDRQPAFDEPTRQPSDPSQNLFLRWLNAARLVRNDPRRLDGSNPAAGM